MPFASCFGSGPELVTRMVTPRRSVEKLLNVYPEISSKTPHAAELEGPKRGIITQLNSYLRIQTSENQSFIIIIEIVSLNMPSCHTSGHSHFKISEWQSLRNFNAAICRWIGCDCWHNIGSLSGVGINEKRLGRP